MSGAGGGGAGGSGLPDPLLWLPRARRGRRGRVPRRRCPVAGEGNAASLGILGPSGLGLKKRWLILKRHHDCCFQYSAQTNARQSPYTRKILRLSGIRASDVAGEVWVWRSVLQSGIAIHLFDLEMVVISDYQLLNKHALVFGSSNVIAQAGHCILKQVLNF